MKKRMYKLLALGMALSMNLSMVQPVMAFDDSNLSAECMHDQLVLEPNSDDPTTHYVLCNICDEVLDVEAHLFDRNNLCICGVKHTWIFDEASDDDGSHLATCLECDDMGYYEHLYENGECSECGHICQHSDFDEFDNCIYCGLPVEETDQSTVSAIMENIIGNYVCDFDPSITAVIQRDGMILTSPEGELTGTLTEVNINESEGYVELIYLNTGDDALFPIYFDTSDRTLNFTNLIFHAVPTCDHDDTKDKLWKYADADKHILVCECGKTVEEGSHNQNACDPIIELDPDTNEYISTQHIYHCNVCYGEDTANTEDHIFETGNASCTKCGYVDNSILTSMRNAAKAELDTLAGSYKEGIYGSAMEEVINSAKNDIDTYYDKASMDSRVAEAEAAMPAALLSDTKTDACQKMDQEINKKQRSDEFYETVQEWVNLIQAAEDIDAVQEALTDILENKIPEAEEAHPYVEPLATVYRAIAGSYGNGAVIICKDEDGSMTLLYNGTVMGVQGTEISEDGTIIVYAGYTFTFSDNSVNVSARRPATNLDYTKTGNPEPDNTVPNCPTCHEPMILESTNAEGCSWICDANGCTVSTHKHVSTEICICGFTHIHTFDENGKCTVEDCDYVSPTRELAAKKAEFEAYKEKAAAAADKKATSADSADVKQLITNAKEAIKAVEFDKDNIEAQQAAIEDILNKLDADIAAQKEAEKEPEVLCKSDKVISPKSGFYGLYLNGTYAGDFTFEAVSGGWSIQDSQGYLTVENGVLTHTNVPAAWGYKNGSFYQTVQTPGKGFFGWLFNTKTTTYYYLTSPTSVSTKTVKTEIRETVLATTHTFTGYVNLKDGTHKRTCTVCGGIETEDCAYDEETGYCICGAFDPARVQVTIKATVTKETQKYLLFFTKTTYRATIATQAEGTTVKKVEYSTNGGKTWTKGSSFTSSSAIGSFLVRATDAQGNVYTYTYPEEVIDR